ncbi:MAG: hypothetical protein M1814_001066 [Vezdaea aestivalis]|nr:MAG: hypothetical protein M1814_001066 [Vezdaea aestivalis]
MILRRPIIGTLSTCQCKRTLHSRVTAPPIPSPTPFVPDVQTFLSLIGRDCSKFASKIPSWDALFNLSSLELRNLGVEPTRNRRYLLRWRDNFRKKKYGLGGELTAVKDGVAEFKIVQVPRELVADPRIKTSDKPQLATPMVNPDKKRIIVNVHPGEETKEGKFMLDRRVPWLSFRNGGSTIAGPHVQTVKGSDGAVAQLAVKEGLWENKRGHKVDGGERRKAMVRANRRIEERRTRAAEAAKAK